MIQYLFVSAVVVVWRWIGFVGRLPESLFWRRFLSAVPVAVFAALTVMPLSRGIENAEILALMTAGILMWHTRQFGLSVLAGLAAVWLIGK